MKKICEQAAADAAHVAVYLASRCKLWPNQTGTTIGKDAIELLNLAARLQTWAVDACNYGSSDRQDRAVTRAEERAVVIAHTYGLKVYFQGDPRGWPMYLYPASVTREEVAQSYHSYCGLSGRYGNRT